MANNNFSQISDYFRRSVIDSERLSPNVKGLYDAVKEADKATVTKDSPFAISPVVYQMGEVPPDTTQDIFKALKVSKKVQEVTVVLMPRLDLQQRSSTQYLGRKSPIITPLVVEARLNRVGQLKPGMAPPFVPRNWLEPNQSDDTPFTHADTVDQFLTLHPYNVDSWQDLQSYCLKFLSALQLKKPDIQDDECLSSLWEKPLLTDYVTRSDLGLMLLAPPIRAGFHIEKIYNAILNGAPLNSLYKRLLSNKEVTRQPFEELSLSMPDLALHQGQMTGEFPLAKKQRNALHHINRLRDGSILAINGPPGTGKTTLLRSVVANAWVKSAIAQQEPPIIVAASSSNQAVTNILDSFFKVEEDQVEKSLQGRWLPHVNTYGLYACGNNKANTDNPYPFLTKRDGGLMQTMANEDPLEAMRTHFIQHFETWAVIQSNDNESSISVAEAKQVLHAALLENTQLQKALIEQFLHWQDCIKTINTKFGSMSELEQRIEKIRKTLDTLTVDISKIDEIEHQLLISWQQRAFWRTLLSFIPPIKRSLTLDNELLMRSQGVTLDDYSDEEIRQALQSQVLSHKKQHAYAQEELKDIEKDQKVLYQSQQRFKQLLHQADIRLSDDISLEQLVDSIDTVLRFKAFKLATHYWEACWLIEQEKIPLAVNTAEDRQRRYRHYAKLCPCLVATFNMLPNFFEVSEQDGENWKSTPMVDAIDLLIVDEAGQALPHVAAASFLVAKKAVLVGDVYQIEPVWSLTQGIDRANLQQVGLLQNESDYEDIWLPSELLASKGNLMKLAHKHTPQTQFEELEPGLYLTEHRRCYNEIIHYCNELIYQGRLEPKRGKGTVNEGLPMMGFYHHDSASQSVGSSRVNAAEAEAICLWISQNIDKLTDDSPLEKVVAVITPFASQAKLIKETLSRHKLGKVKAGTVHTFQGAESKVVIFSSVYAANDGAGSKFYDTGPNMLNVAVSRAKDAFIVFGDMNIFGKGSTTAPSTLLKKHLKPMQKKETSSAESFGLIDF